MAAKRGDTPPFVPSDYEEVDYVETAENKCYKTDYIPTKDCRVEVCYEGTYTTSKRSGCLFGCRTAYNNKELYFRVGITGISAENMTVGLGYKTTREFNSPNVVGNKNVYGVDAGRFYINDTTLATYTDDFAPEYALYIMRQNNAGSPNLQTPLGRLYWAKFWDENGVLVRDYHPVKRLSDNVYGLFEVYTQTFLTLE